MKGIVFNLLAEVVSQEYGEQTWDALLEAAEVDGVYTSLGNYPDSDLVKLVSAASSALQLPADEVVRWFGRRALPLLVAKFPQFFVGHQSTRSFLLTLNHIVHPEVRKIHPDADLPVFDYDASSDGVLLMGYRSRRQLCALGEGLIEGAAAHFGELVVIEQPQCVKRGDDRCIFRVALARPTAHDAREA